MESCCSALRSFYMAMREKYTTPGTSIYYYLVEWDPAKLSWEVGRRPPPAPPPKLAPGAAKNIA